jgi:hypothetical protein
MHDRFTWDFLKQRAISGPERERRCSIREIRSSLRRHLDLIAKLRESPGDFLRAVGG